MQYIPKLVGAISTFYFTSNYKTLLQTYQQLKKNDMSQRSIASSLLFKIENGMVVTNSQLDQIFLKNPSITVHNDSLPNSIFKKLSEDHKFQRSKRGCFSIGPKGQVTATWKSIQFLEDCIVSGDIDEFVASKSRMNLDQFKDSYLVAEIDSQNKIVDTFKRWIQ